MSTIPFFREKSKEFRKAYLVRMFSPFLMNASTMEMKKAQEMVMESENEEKMKGKWVVAFKLPLSLT